MRILLDKHVFYVYNISIEIVPMHNKDLGKGLEDTILKQAGLK
ncbi:TPA: type II toxin-antitoxin system HicA family toxin [Streptococcus agalactiae]